MIDVSNRRFYFNDSINLEVLTIYGTFYTNNAASLTKPLTYDIIRVTVSNVEYESNLLTPDTVYYNGTWHGDEYRTIVFSPDTTLTETEYAWIIANATEITPYFTSSESLGQVANAIRERSWSTTLLTYPNDYDTAIRAIGNYVEGATVAWNQLASLDAADWQTQRTTLSVTDQTMTVTTTSPSGQKYVYLELIKDHKYYMSAYVTPDADNALMYGVFYNLSGGYSYREFIPSGSPETAISTILNARNNTNNYFAFVFATAVPSGISSIIRNTMLIDLTVLLGADVADQIYALEDDTAGAGVAAFKALFPSDYYQPQLTPVLTSVNYQDDIPVNDPVVLRGVYRLDSDNNIIRYGDEYNNGTALRWYYEFSLDSLTWTYNSTYDYFVANPAGPDSELLTGPYWDDVFVNAITDYLPLKLLDISDDPYTYLTTADNGMYLGYFGGGQWHVSELYVKDSTITSDHVNTLLAKLSGKKIVMRYVNSYYETL